MTLPLPCSMTLILLSWLPAHPPALAARVGGWAEESCAYKLEMCCAFGYTNFKWVYKLQGLWSLRCAVQCSVFNIIWSCHSIIRHASFEGAKGAAEEAQLFVTVGRSHLKFWRWKPGSRLQVWLAGVVGGCGGRHGYYGYSRV